MATPFLDDPVDLGARVVKGSLRRARTFRDRHNPLAYPEDVIQERYRFSTEGIVYLCKLLEPHVSNATRRSRALTVTQTVCIALRFFANGTYMHNVGDAENLSKNTACRAIRKVVLALIQLVDAFVVFPGHLPTLSIKEGFCEFAGFPRVIGAIDCTHIPLTAASLDQCDVNRKYVHNIIVQMTCDHQLLVTSFDARWPESITRLNNPCMFQESALGQRFEDGQYDGFLLGNQGYACMPYLMTPYPDPQTEPQKKYNVALSKTRARIDMTCEAIKSRFGCLRGLRVSPERACQIVSACVVLHNIATIRKERGPPVDSLPTDAVSHKTPDHPTGSAVREAITAEFFT